MWSKLGDVNPVDLVNARLELHWAAQIPAAAGSTLLPLRADASHTSLAWIDSIGALAGEPISGKRAGLRLSDNALVVLDANDSVVAELSLTGKTLDEGMSWLAKELGAEKLTRPKHDLPVHPVATGAAFANVPREHLVELARWFSNAHHAITEAAREKPNASTVRCWPHHFDIASLVKLDENRSIGIGMSPGDGDYAEPYFYVTPWPYPPHDMTLPAVRGVRWHTQGWTGAVLTGSRLIVVDSQERAAHDMLRESYEAAFNLMTPASAR
jgi:hypothetical protein